MKKAVLNCLVLMLTGIAGAANVPSGLTGLWRFQNGANLGAATVGNDIMFSNAVYGTQFLGPWTDIGVEWGHTMFSDGYVFQESSLNYLAVNPAFSANSGGSYVNEYTVAIDYVQTQTGTNSIFQTARDGHANDGDLWIDGTTPATSTIYTTELGPSILTFDSSKWHRIVWSVDNGNFFRVYVDGTNYLDGAGQAIDGRYSVYPDRFNLFADDDIDGSWADRWGLVGTVMTWNRALTSAEVAGLGGWTNGAATPTPLIFSGIPEVTSVSPADGETNVAPNFAYQATILDIAAVVDNNSIQLLLDGIPVTPVVTTLAGAINVSFSAGGLLRSGSTHKYTLTGTVSGGSSSMTNEVTFKVQNYTSYEWRFTSGDLTTDLGNGTMSYVAGPAGTTFGTTDGSTVPHIAGSPAKYMHVPGFTLDSDGYWLDFKDSGPNTSGSASINRYTLIFDLLVPSPWPLDYLVPFFNTAPYNDNDADFYLYGDGEIGIGANYSSPGAMTPNVWQRVAFVADLAANTLTYYVNGTNVESGAADGIDGRWSIFSNQQVGALPLYPANLLLFNEGDTSGVYTHELYLSSVAFTDRVLGAAELTALGRPSANGILVRSFAPRPALAIHASGGGATISWPTNYVGYALEQSASLTTPQWKPVSGITNNAVNVVPGSAAKFFHLVQ